jgi:hypothetical protein
MPRQRQKEVEILPSMLWLRHWGKVKMREKIMKEFFLREVFWRRNYEGKYFEGEIMKENILMEKLWRNEIRRRNYEGMKFGGEIMREFFWRKIFVGKEFVQIRRKFIDNFQLIIIWGGHYWFINKSQSQVCILGAVLKLLAKNISFSRYCEIGSKCFSIQYLRIYWSRER